MSIHIWICGLAWTSDLWWLTDLCKITTGIWNKRIKFKAISLSRFFICTFSLSLQLQTILTAMEEYAEVCTCFQRKNAFGANFKNWIDPSQQYSEPTEESVQARKRAASWNRGRSLPLYCESSCLRNACLSQSSSLIQSYRTATPNK